MTKYQFMKEYVVAGVPLVHEIPLNALDVRTHIKTKGGLQFVVTWLEEVEMEI